LFDGELYLAADLGDRLIAAGFVPALSAARTSRTVRRAAPITIG